MNKIYCPENKLNCNINLYANNVGGGMTMKKKYASKFNKVSSNTQFSINGINNRNIHSLVGNPNNMISHDPFSDISNALCKTNDNTIKTSVKNTKGLISSKLVINNKHIPEASPLYSQKCYNIVNKELLDLYNDSSLNTCFAINPNSDLIKTRSGLNKFFNLGNTDQSTYIYYKKYGLGLSRQNYLSDISNNTGTNNCGANKIVGTNRVNTLKTQCNITKDMNHVPGYTPGYQIYYNDSTLFTKKKCLYNPPDAKILAC